MLKERLSGIGSYGHSPVPISRSPEGIQITVGSVESDGPGMDYTSSSHSNADCQFKLLPSDEEYNRVTREEFCYDYVRGLNHSPVSSLVSCMSCLLWILFRLRALPCVCPFSSCITTSHSVLMWFWTYVNQFLIFSDLSHLALSALKLIMASSSGGNIIHSTSF